jgi:hypothetical protein
VGLRAAGLGSVKGVILGREKGVALGCDLTTISYSAFVIGNGYRSPATLGRPSFACGCSGFRPSLALAQFSQPRFDRRYRPLQLSGYYRLVVAGCDHRGQLPIVIGRPGAPAGRGPTIS